MGYDGNPIVFSTQQNEYSPAGIIDRFGKIVGRNRNRLVIYPDKNFRIQSFLVVARCSAQGRREPLQPAT